VGDVMSGRTFERGITLRLTHALGGSLHAAGRTQRSRFSARDVGERNSRRAMGARRSLVRRVRSARLWCAARDMSSQLFVASPSVLGEAYLEIGPPPTGEAKPDRSRTAPSTRPPNPVDIDRSSSTPRHQPPRRMLALVREQGPREFEELLL